jgi:hypothetical protein
VRPKGNFRLSQWFLETENILVVILVINFKVSSLENHYLDPPHIMLQISREFSSKTNSPLGCLNSSKDVQFIALPNYKKRLLTSINHSLNNISSIASTMEVVCWLV